MTLHRSVKWLFAGALLLTSTQLTQAEEKQDVVRDGRGAVVVNTFGNCVNTKWEVMGGGCGTVVERKARKMMGADVGLDQRTVYFEFNKATLTPEGKDRLNALADVLKADGEVKQAQIVGYADRIGGAAYNEKLSRKRAETVKNYLISRGFINTHVAETRWLGSSAPRAHCSNKLPRAKLIACLQQDRRVEVEIEYATPKGRR